MFGSAVRGGVESCVSSLKCLGVFATLCPHVGRGAADQDRCAELFRRRDREQKQGNHRLVRYSKWMDGAKMWTVQKHGVNLIARCYPVGSDLSYITSKSSKITCLLKPT